MKIETDEATMSGEQDRGNGDVRLAVVEEKIDAMKAQLNKLEEKLDKYNQYRERVDNLGKNVETLRESYDGHNARHWQFWFATAAPVIAGVVILFFRR